MPAPETMIVRSVGLGNEFGADGRIKAAKTNFAKTDTVHPSVATSGKGKLTAKWMSKNGRVIDTQDRAVAARPQISDFSASQPDGWPAGKYTLEISTDGSVVQSRAFEKK